VHQKKEIVFWQKLRAWKRKDLKLYEVALADAKSLTIPGLPEPSPTFQSVPENSSPK